MSATSSASYRDAAPAKPAETTNRLAAPEPIGETLEIDRDFLRATVVYDLLWSVFHVATIATLLNACAKTDAEWTLRSWRHLLFDNNKIMQLALRYGAEIGLSEAITADTSRFYQAVAEEKRRLAPLANTSASYSAAARRQIAAASAVWSQLARQAKSILSAFEADTMRQMGELLIEDARMLLQFLDEAGRGSYRRVSAFGEISLPVMNQIRREPRLPIDGQCTVMIEDKAVAAALNDISTYGMSIICDQAVTEKQPITVVLEDGRRLTGTVARRHGDRVALLFDTRLSHSDPLFRRTRRRDPGARRQPEIG